jgi:redox-sensing transcriptional repressor
MKIGRTIHDKHVLSTGKLTDLTQRMHVLIGIITVPASEAQAVADLLLAGGIRAIWNFAPVRLRVPENIIVRNEDLYCSLASLSQKVAKELQANPPQHPAAEEPQRATTMN